MSDTAKRWLVYSRQHNMWWRPGARGYTPNIEAAGRYTYAEALRFCRSDENPARVGPPEFMSLAPEFALVEANTDIPATTEPLRIAELESGVRAAALRFREYERGHTAKGTTSGDEKALRNADIAAMLEALLEGGA